MAKYFIEDRGLILTDPVLKVVGEAGVGFDDNETPVSVFAYVTLTENGKQPVYTRFVSGVVPDTIDINNFNAWALLQLELLKISE